MSNPFEPPRTTLGASPAERLRADAATALRALVLIPVGMCTCYLTWPVAFASMLPIFLRRRTTPYSPVSPEERLLERVVATGIGVTFVSCAGLAVIVLFYAGIFALALLSDATT